MINRTKKKFCKLSKTLEIRFQSIFQVWKSTKMFLVKNNNGLDLVQWKMLIIFQMNHLSYISGDRTLTDEGPIESR